MQTDAQGAAKIEMPNDNYVAKKRPPVDIDKLYPSHEPLTPERYDALFESAKCHLIEEFGITEKEAAEFVREFLEMEEEAAKLTPIFRQALEKVLNAQNGVLPGRE